MGFNFEKGVDKVADTMENILQRSEELIELINYKRRYQKYEEKVEEHFTVLGKLLYDRYLEKQETESVYRPVCHEIDAIRRKMEELSHEIDKLESKHSKPDK